MTATATRSMVATVHFEDEKDLNRARAEWPYEQALIYLDACIVDDTYQRPGQTSFVRSLVENFDETLVGSLAVNERKNKRLAILDGQQRFLAMGTVGKTSCWASVYRGMSVKDEAGFFYRMNKDRKTMESYYGFRARRVAGDPVAEMITMIVESEGFSIAHSSNDNDVIGAVRSLEVAYHYTSDVRDDALAPTLRTIRESIYGRKNSLNTWIIQGLARFWSLTADDEVDRKVLNDIIADYGPGGLMAMVREKQAQQRGRTQPVILAQFLATRYNHLVRGTDKPKLTMSRYQ